MPFAETVQLDEDVVRPLLHFGDFSSRNPRYTKNSFFLLVFDATIYCHFIIAQCFGGMETYEKTAGVAFATVSNLQGLVSQPGTAVTRDCAALCRQTSTCAAFTVGALLSL